MILAAPLVLPRWEWRTFAPSLARVREQVSGVTIAPLEARSETYLLCLRSSHSAKLRSNGFQLKWRKQLDPEGLELWDPILKSPFPVTPSFVACIFEAWGFSNLSLPEGDLERGPFLAALRELVPTLRCVDVVKQHECFLLDGAACKFTRFAGLGTELESFCIEHEDPEILKPVLRRLGLDTHENINVPKGLKRALGLS